MFRGIIMNTLNDITDSEFVPFLQSLGVDTCKSYEWMLNDPDFAGVLRWIYSSLDHNNALTAREEYRYNELKKKVSCLSPEDLESTIASIQEQYPGICLPGDQESKEDIELDVKFQEERLHLLGKHETIVRDLIKQNESIKDQLSLELTQLNATHHQCKEDEAKAAEECTSLAKEVESLTDELIVAVSDNLDVYSSCKGNKDMSQRFITFSPIESYHQSQALLRSHHELFVSKNFGNKPNKANEELRVAALEAKNMEDRLLTAALAYVKSKADLSGEQAKLALISNYNKIHPSQIAPLHLEVGSAMELLEREENMCEGEVQHCVTELAKGTTVLATRTAVKAAANASRQVLSSLTHLVDIWQKAYALDRILYYSLRHELRTLEEFVQFAAELRQYAVEESSAVAARIDATNELILEHATRSEKATNIVLQTLCSLLGLDTKDAGLVVKEYNNLRARVKELEENVQEGYRKREMDLVEFKKSTRLLHNAVWSSCTKQAHCWDLSVASLSHSLRHRMEQVDARVLDATHKFTTVKNGDKQKLRKLWQWFLTDQTKFLAAVKNCTL